MKCVAWNKWENGRRGDTVYCALPEGSELDPNAVKDDTLCHHVVCYRIGSIDGEPTCPDCLAILQNRKTTKLLRFEGSSVRDFGEFQWCEILMHRTDDNPKVPWFMYPNDKNSRGFVVVGEWHEDDRTWRITVRIDETEDPNLPILPDVRFWYTDTITVDHSSGTFKTEVLHMEVPADTSLWNPKMSSW